MMELTLHRDDFSLDRTLGSLSVEDIFRCFTVEDCVRAVGEKIAGKTAIPAGRYRVVITQSERFTRMKGHPVFTPLLMDVPNFAGIRIHSGNSANDTEGCILPGLERTKDGVAHSLPAYDQIYDMIDDAIDRGEQVWITVS